ncbi:Anion-transporting ATPase [Polaribacter irgensii 23-P]|uniref:arsenite-transporting ATPase n=1 Tax=Polaribacter irgensii 23-P TaxID=313594 RepID=A4BWG2_9FLAO|nr:ArsA family ATPase [Polaribacter irgensii]EAR13303.1 Anion-transporting ATPase [Polaribacter irgensii 23-P]
MALSGLDNTNLKLILVGGKGGVGKTSCATSIGLELSKTHKTLIISTDPAHSISDCLGQKTRNGIHFIDGDENLAVTEIFAEQVYADFKDKHEEELRGLFETSTKLDSEDIDDLLKLSIPGIDEVMSLMTIIDIIEKGEFDKYVVDTAPTGHALRMISSPKVLDEWIKVAARMRWKYRYMVTSFSGTYTEDKTDALLLNLKKTVKKIERLFRDVSQCEFIPVCIPESMAVLETNRLIASLDSSNLSVRQMIVNNVLQSEGCSFCRERQKEQQKYLLQISETYPKLNRVIMPLFASEIKGFEKLNQMRKLLFK